MSGCNSRASRASPSWAMPPALVTAPAGSYSTDPTGPTASGRAAGSTTSRSSGSSSATRVPGSRPRPGPQPDLDGVAPLAHPLRLDHGRDHPVRQPWPELHSGGPVTGQQRLDERPRWAQVLHPPAPSPAGPAGRVGERRDARTAQQRGGQLDRVPDQHLGPVAEIGLGDGGRLGIGVHGDHLEPGVQQSQRVGADAAAQIDHPAYAGGDEAVRVVGGDRRPAGLFQSGPGEQQPVGAVAELGPGRASRSRPGSARRRPGPVGTATAARSPRPGCPGRVARPRRPAPRRRPGWPADASRVASQADATDRQSTSPPRCPAARVPCRRSPPRRRARRSWRRCPCRARDAGSAAGYPAAAARSASSSRSRRLAATPPPISRSVAPVAWQASIALALSTSQTASWKLAATSAVGTSRPSASAVSTYRATEVFRPEKEKSNRCRSRSRRPVSPRGKAIAVGSPSAAAGRCAVRPDRAATSSRATLSYASPAASSMVLPSSVIEWATSSTCSSEVCPPETSSARHGLRQRAVLDQVDGDVSGQVVDPVQRLVQREGQGLGGRQTDDQRAHQTRPGGDGDAVDLGEVDVGGLPGPDAGSAASPPGGPGWRPRAPPRRSGRARRRWTATSLASSSVPRTTPTPVSSQDDSMPRISGPLTTGLPFVSVAAGAGRRPARQVPQPQDQRVPTRPVVVVACGQLLEPETLVQGDGRVVVPGDLQHHRAGAARAGPPSDRPRPGPRRCPAGGAAGRRPAGAGPRRHPPSAGRSRRPGRASGPAAWSARRPAAHPASCVRSTARTVRTR